MSTPRERAHKHADQNGTRKMSEPFAAPWPADGGGDEMICIRELGAIARITFVGELEVDTASGTGKLDMTSLLPYATDLIVDAEKHEPVFEIADHDWLVETYPALVEKALLTSVGISDIGDAAAQAAEGNSVAIPS